MNQTLDKINRLGKIIAYNDSEDQVLDKTIDKILHREINKIQAQIEKFNHQLFEFEDKYGLDSTHFINQYEKGTLGDDIDFVEWISTIEMKRKAEEYIFNVQDS